MGASDAVAPSPAALGPSDGAVADARGAVAAAHDAVAADYDRRVAEDRWMRRLLWERYARLFGPGDRVLDAGCGTGLDALFLAERGVAVVAVDLAPAMLAEVEARARSRGLADRIATRLLDLGDLDGAAQAVPSLRPPGGDRDPPAPPGALWPAATFDGVVSGFAAANGADLDRFAAGAALLLRPGGRMVLHLLAPAGIWTRLAALARLDPRAAAALARRRARAVTIAGHPLRLAVAPAEEVYRRHFAPRFHLRDRFALGFLWPRRAGRLLPAGLALRLGRLEPVLGRRRPLLGWGRFVVLDLERR
jgi:SAM-dependent methyltransferase